MTVDEIRQKLEEHDELKTRLRTKSYDEHQRILDEVYKVRDDLSVNECRKLLAHIAALETALKEIQSHADNLIPSVFPTVDSDIEWIVERARKALEG